MEETVKKTNYELAYLLKTTETDAELSAVLKDAKAEISEKSPIATVQLAYPIKKQASAQFGYLHLTVPSGDAIEAISHSLNLKASVLRFLFVKVPKLRVKKVSSEKSPEEVVKKEVVTEKVSLELSNANLEKTLEDILK